MATGDPLIDRWEKEIASGKVPDLSEGMTEEENKKLVEWSKRVSRDYTPDITDG